MTTLVVRRRVRAGETPILEVKADLSDLMEKIERAKANGGEVVVLTTLPLESFPDVDVEVTNKSVSFGLEIVKP